MDNTQTIIILDDEQEILDLLNKFFTRTDMFKIIKHINPLDAIETIKTNKIDILLTDIMMPQMNGIEVLKEVKNFNPSIKVIIMTAYSTIDRVIECEKLGADDYITKPFESLKIIEEKIIELLKDT
jgi:DNA-binding NtrC family response regulator